ncbi:MAG: hypothetical protein ACYC91_13930 [Solirubrobacteraceae bacterium]
MLKEAMLLARGAVVRHGAERHGTEPHGAAAADRAVAGAADRAVAGAADRAARAIYEAALERSPRVPGRGISVAMRAPPSSRTP